MKKLSSGIFAILVLSALHSFAGNGDVESAGQGSSAAHCKINIATVLSDMSASSGQAIVNILEKKGYQPITDTDMNSGNLFLVNQSTRSKMKESFLGDYYYMTIEPKFSIIGNTDSKVVVGKSSNVGTYTWVRSGDQSLVNKALLGARQKIMHAIDSLPNCPE